MAISRSIFVAALGLATFTGALSSSGCSSSSTATPAGTDGGSTSDGGATSEGGGSGSGSCSTLSAQCAACANAAAKDTCNMYASGGDEGHCKTIVDAKTFMAGSTACMP